MTYAPDAAIESFSKWLRVRDSNTLELRKNIARHLLSLYDVERFSDLSQIKQHELIKALGVQLPTVEERPGEANIADTGYATPKGRLAFTDMEKPRTPEVKIGDHVEVVKEVYLTPTGFASRSVVKDPEPYTPGPRGAVAERPEDPWTFRVEDSPEEPTDEDYMAIVKKARETMADREGRLWMVMVAYYEHVAYMQVHQGRVADNQFEMFKSQYASAGMFLDPTPVIGDLSHARAEAAREFAKNNPSDLRIKVYLRKAQ